MAWAASRSLFTTSNGPACSRRPTSCANSLKKINPSLNLKASNFGEEKYLYLTTRGRKTGLPREIEIWFTYHDGRFCLIAEYATSNWIQNLTAHPEAQMRVGGESFAVRARTVSPNTEPELHSTICDLSRKKYGWGDGSVVELEPVSTPSERL